MLNGSQKQNQYRNLLGMFFLQSVYDKEYAKLENDFYKNYKKLPKIEHHHTGSLRRVRCSISGCCYSQKKNVE